MKRYTVIIIFFYGFIVPGLFAQYKEPAGSSRIKDFSICLYATYVASAEIQYDITSSDLFGVNTFSELNGTYGYGGEFSYKLPFNDLDLALFVSTEYYHLIQNNIPFRFTMDTLRYTVSVTEDISMYPVEFGIKWDLPEFLENFTFYIGGGGGIYWGNRTRKLLNISTQIIQKKSGFSLNALAGVEYSAGRNFSLDFQLKFREPYFDIESTYNTNIININGSEFELKSPVTSRITVNGLRLSFGLKYNF